MGSVYVNCDYCGKRIRIINRMARRYTRHYCNNTCKHNGFRRDGVTANSGENAKNHRLRNHGPLLKIGGLVYGIGPTPVTVQEFEQMKSEGKFYCR